MQSGDVSPVPRWRSSWGKHRPWRGTAGQTARAGEPCPFETKHRGMARGSKPASAKGPGLFPPAIKRKKNDWGDGGKWEQQRISALAPLFVRQQRAYDIQASFTAGWSEVSSGTSATCTLFCSQSHKDGFPRCKDLIFFFLLGCYPEHSNLIRPFDKHLTQSSGLLSLLPTAQGKRLRLTNFHPQFSLFYLHLSNSMPVSVTQRWGKSKPLSS